MHLLPEVFIRLTCTKEDYEKVAHSCLSAHHDLTSSVEYAKNSGLAEEQPRLFQLFSLVPGIFADTVLSVYKLELKTTLVKENLFRY